MRNRTSHGVSAGVVELPARLSCSPIMVFIQSHRWSEGKWDVTPGVRHSYNRADNLDATLDGGSRLKQPAALSAARKLRRESSAMKWQRFVSLMAVVLLAATLLAGLQTGEAEARSFRGGFRGGPHHGGGPSSRFRPWAPFPWKQGIHRGGSRVWGISVCVLGLLPGVPRLSGVHLPFVPNLL